MPPVKNNGYTSLWNAAIRDERLTPQQKVVMMQLVSWDFTGKGGRICPSRARIATGTGLQPRQLHTILKSLKAQGLIDWHTPPGHTSVFRILDPVWHKANPSQPAPVMRPRMAGSIVTGARVPVRKTKPKALVKRSESTAATDGTLRARPRPVTAVGRGSHVPGGRRLSAGGSGARLPTTRNTYKDFSKKEDKEEAFDSFEDDFDEEDFLFG